MIRVADIESDQNGHAGESDQQSDRTPEVDLVGVRAQPVHDPGDQRDAGDQESGGGTGQMLLGPGQEQPWDGQVRPRQRRRSRASEG